MKKDKNGSLLAAWVSLFSNVALTFLKIIVGTLFNSQVLVADGIHNAGDVIASGAALSSMQISNRPADDDHPYGHGKAEVLGAALVAVILAAAAVYMGYHSILTLFHEPAHPSILPLLAAAVSVVWKQALYVYTMRVGQKSRSKGLIATAKDHLADVYASLAAVIGIFLALVGDYYGISILAYGDPVAGIIVSLLVLRLAYGMGKESLDILMEHSVDPEKLTDYASLIHSVPQVKRIDRLRAREHGHYIIVDVRLSVSGYLTVQEGHDISREIKTSIQKAHTDVDEVLVHLNPWYEDKQTTPKRTKTE
jgi:cation diffusion facilitator family transporter